MKSLTFLMKASLCVACVLASLGAMVSFVAAQTCVEPPAGLVSWWPGEENADDLGNGNDGTLQNGATFAPGMVGQAFSFDGIDDAVHVGNDPSLRVSAGNFTVEAWVKFAREGVYPDVDDMSIADKMSHAGINQDGWRLMRQRDHGHFWFCLGGGDINGCDFNDDRTGTNATSVRSHTVARQNVWYHVVAVLGSNHMAIYVNGSREGEKARPVFTDTHATDLLIGNDLGSARLDGLVDEVSIYNRALSAQEIAAIFTAGSSGKCVVIRCNGLEPTLVGTTGHDVLEGTAGDDVIAGLDGNDTINGRGGDDVICGGPGHDVLLGGPGHDTLLGEGGNDTLHGGADNDVLFGGLGNDTLSGGAGIDLLFGEEGNDTLHGREGSDVLLGGPGNDTCQPGPGTDDFAEECEGENRGP
jgi:Ca2+-binding RTX toxin-like protein